MKLSLQRSLTTIQPARVMRSVAVLAASAATLGFSGVASAQFEAPGGQAQQGQAQQQPAQAPPTEAVAVVNDEPITKTEFQTALEARLRQGGGNDPAAVQQAQKEVIEGLVESRLVEQHLIKKGPEVPPQEVKAVIDQYKEQMQAQGVGFDQFLQSSGYTEDALQRRIEGSLAWQKFQEQEMTEDKLQQHFTENEDRFPADDFEQAKPMVQQSYANTLWAKIVETARPQAEIEVKSLGQPNVPNRPRSVPQQP